MSRTSQLRPTAPSRAETCGNFPSFEEGWLRPTNKMSRYRKQGAAGEVSLTPRLSVLTSPAAPILR
jgi:hypothetical protein